jgi:hypothetical protein
MRGLSTGIVSAAVATALLATSTAGIAAPTPPPAPQLVQPAPSAWLTLSMLNSSGAAALGEGIGQPAPPPDNPPPGEPYAADHIPVPVIAFWLITIAAMIYIATRHSRGHIEIRVPNSPA